MAFTLTARGLRDTVRKTGSETVRFGGLAIGASVAGAVAARQEHKAVTAGVSTGLGLAGMMFLPPVHDMADPLLRGVSEGLLGGGSAQIGALLGEKFLK